MLHIIKFIKKSEGQLIVNYKIISILSYLISIIFIGFGFNKMFVYESSESYLKDSVNAYVGGDAYNYIINSNYTIGYFVLALIFVVLASSFLIIDSIKKIEKQNTVIVSNNSQENISTD